MSFNIGDQVQLKSGGPCMTTAELLPTQDWKCIWFDQSETLQHGFFPPNTLTTCKSVKEKTRAAQAILDLNKK